MGGFTAKSGVCKKVRDVATQCNGVGSSGLGLQPQLLIIARITGIAENTGEFGHSEYRGYKSNTGNAKVSKLLGMLGMLEILELLAMLGNPAITGIDDNYGNY